MPCGVPLSVDLGKAKALYLSGKTPRDIAKTMGINVSTLYGRIHRERWSVEKVECQKLVVKAAVDTIAQRAVKWVDDTITRTQLFRTVISKSLTSAKDNLDVDKLPIALDQLTKAEQRVDDMGRRALNLVDPKVIDVTSGGMPLGSYNGALEEVRKMLLSGQNKIIDVDAIAGKLVEEEDR